VSIASGVNNLEAPNPRSPTVPALSREI